MNRRTFLEESAAAAAVIGLAPFLMGADRHGWSEEHVEGFLERLQRRVEHARTHAERIRSRASPGAEASAYVSAMTDAWPAVLGVTTIGSVPLEVQAHPAVQAVLRDHLEVVGRTAEVVVGELRRLRDALPEDDEDGPNEVEGFQRVEEELGVEDLPEGVRRRLRHGLERAGWDLGHRPLRAVIEEQLSALERRLDLASRPEAALASVEVHDPTVVETTRRGAGRGRKDDHPRPTGERAARIVGGILVMGLGVVVGIPLVVVGVEAMACPCVGLPVLLLGTSLIVSGGVLGYLLIRGRPPVSTRVDPGEGWVRTGARVRDGSHTVLVTGELRYADGVKAGPDGLPAGLAGYEPLESRFTLGALLGRVRGSVFQVSAGRPMSCGEHGVLYLAINLTRRSEVEGGFDFRVEPL